MRPGSEATALAVACQDQYRGGLRPAFLKWANPDAPVTAANKGVTPGFARQVSGRRARCLSPSEPTQSWLRSQRN